MIPTPPRIARRPWNCYARKFEHPRRSSIESPIPTRAMPPCFLQTWIPVPLARDAVGLRRQPVRIPAPVEHSRAASYRPRPDRAQAWNGDGADSNTRAGRASRAESDTNQRDADIFPANVSSAPPRTRRSGTATLTKFGYPRPSRIESSVMIPTRAMPLCFPQREFRPAPSHATAVERRCEQIRTPAPVEPRCRHVSRKREFRSRPSHATAVEPRRQPVRIPAPVEFDRPCGKNVKYFERCVRIRNQHSVTPFPMENWTTSRIIANVSPAPGGRDRCV